MTPSDRPWDGGDDAERTQEFAARPDTTDAERTRDFSRHDSPDADRTQDFSGARAYDFDRTQQLPTQPPVVPHDDWSDAHRTRELPTYDEPAANPLQPRREPVAVPAPQAWGPDAGAAPYATPGIGLAGASAADDTDPHDSDTWRWQMARLHNKPSTDFGLLLLRLLSLPLVLHGIHKLVDFGGFAGALRGNAIGALAPEIIGVAIVAGQILLPLMIAVGAMTRLSALLQAVMMGAVYAFWVLASEPVLNPATGGLSGEAALAYAALALPLFFTGAGRFSVDHGLTTGRRERTADKRVAKAAR
ncbi:DoxX family protein [Propioniciclava soli]|uniref:DoxX family protein n=1 Tax=Propioniciclava soli TaxID=2775081 RepID=A0ABZ3CBW3_9ACTN|nr:DoxX family protein [Propioniciclava soli]